MRSDGDRIYGNQLFGDDVQAHAVSAAAGLGGRIKMVDHREMRALNGRPNEIDFFASCRAASEKARTELQGRPHRPGVIDELATLPQTLGLNTGYPEPKRQRAASFVSV
ncbi:hypothetical protein A5621_13515 [Mycobacterium colombiense]|uniref:hypothetical protein n=1 Tax=Mycobacterium colombiense TaxID=339268 RepID=UPI000800824C|nr:hypothetical protein [Mycobacterium colombiense]OBJ38372.1 hypothetical protein A5621_13515 [Mycobacterium colombiense]